MRRVALRNSLLTPLRRRQFASFGVNSIIDRPLWLYGTSHISIGEGVVILRDGWISVERVAWGRGEPSLVIGDRVSVRTGCTIAAAESVVIEDDVGIGANVTILDSSHTWDAGNPNPMHNPIKTSPVRVGQGTWLADHVVIAAGADIGRQCAISANSVVSGKVPDFSVVAGNPGRVVGRTQQAE